MSYQNYDFDEFVGDFLWDAVKRIGEAYRKLEDDSPMDCDQTEEITGLFRHYLDVNEGNVSKEEQAEFMKSREEA